MRRKKETPKTVGDRVMERLDLPADLVLNLPVITLSGNRSVLVENYKGIIDFEDAVIRLNTVLGILLISGCDFDIRGISDESIEISGRIHSVEFVK